MLKPYVCVACERVILEQAPEGSPPGTSGVPSLIGLFNRIIAIVPPVGQETLKIAPNAAVPKEWAVFSAWDVEPDDEERKYTVCTQIVYPDQTPFGAISKVPLKIEPRKRSQNILRVFGFPIGQAGFYKVQTWIEENEERVFGPIEFKIELEIQKQEQAQMVQQ
jgi:hypothetical protein